MRRAAPAHSDPCRSLLRDRERQVWNPACPGRDVHRDGRAVARVGQLVDRERARAFVRWRGSSVDCQRGSGRDRVVAGVPARHREGQRARDITSPLLGRPVREPPLLGPGGAGDPACRTGYASCDSAHGADASPALPRPGGSLMPTRPRTVSNEPRGSLLRSADHARMATTSIVCRRPLGGRLGPRGRARATSPIERDVAARRPRSW